jgi:hypothetical protein
MPKVKIVEETDYGLYLWEMPDGSIVADDEKNFLNIPGKRGDMSKIKIITEAARSFGIEEGKAVFLSGHRRVTEEEYEYQKQRLEWGLVPDELDYGAARDELMNYKRGLK